MADAIIIGALIIIGFVALSSTVRHFKGGGACCGGGDCAGKGRKKLENPRAGEKRMRIEGMHCDQCKNRVEYAVNALDGAACRVNLRKKEAVVIYSKEIEDQLLRNTIGKLGYEVISITKQRIR